MSARVAVLASGGGSNLRALLDHFAALGAAASGAVALVVSNRATAGALARARNAALPALHIAAEDGDALLSALARHAVDVIALAGYLALIPERVILAYPGRIVNIHPGPLPDFGGHGMYGRRVHEAVLASGAHESAATVHLVNERYDDGPVLARWPVPVHPGDSAATLGARVLAAEHIVYPRIVDALCATVAADAPPSHPR